MSGLGARNVTIHLFDPGPGDGTEVCCGHHELNHEKERYWRTGEWRPICWQCGTQWYNDERANQRRFLARLPIIGDIWLWLNPIPHYEYHDFKRAIATPPVGETEQSHG